jgi:hypothetical protein
VSRTSSPSSPFIWHLVSLAAGAVFLMYVNRAQWFFGDEWDFLADRSITIGNDGLFVPHNEHWSTTPILLYGLLFRLFGLSSYAPYVAVVVIAHLAVVHLMWRVMLRGGCLPWAATVACAAFIPFGPGAENLLWAFQIGFVGSVGFGLAAILLADHDQPFGRRDLAVWGVSILGLTFSGISVPLVGAAALAAWMRRGLRAAMFTAVIPAGAYLVWLFTAGQQGLGAIAPVTSDSLRVFPEFAWLAANSLLSLGTPTFLVGLLPLILAVIALVIRRRRSMTLPYAALAAAIGEVFLLAMLAIGRAPFGLEAAEASRYVHLGAALLLPLLVVGLSDLVRPHVAGVVLLSLLLGAWTLNNGRLLLGAADVEAERERLIHEQFVAAATLVEGPTLRDRPDPVYSLDLHLPELRELFPTFQDGVTASREGTIRAALALQVSITPEPLNATTMPLSSIAVLDASIRPAAAGCVDVVRRGAVPRLVLPVGTPSSYELTPSFPGHLELMLASGGVRPEYRDGFGVEAGVPVFINLAIDLVPDGSLTVGLPGRVTVCAV